MRARALLLGLVLFAGVRCAEAPPERPHVVFISVDDLLPRLGCYGVGDAHTPNIDELAREGALFQRAYAQFAQCGPSRASVLTGLLPERCGVLRNDADYRATIGDQRVLPELFREAGWRTIALGKVHHGQSVGSAGTRARRRGPSSERQRRALLKRSDISCARSSKTTQR